MNQNNKYTIQGDQLIVGNNIIKFDFPIGKEFVEINDMLILRLEKPFRVIYNENIFGVSLTEKRIKWQIAKLKYATGTDCPFIGVDKFGDNIKLYNWCDIYLIVDPMTGDILERSEPAKY